MTVLADIDAVLGPELSSRLAAELSAALRRRPAQEARLAGALRVVCPRSERLREASAAALDVLIRRNSLERPLYWSCLRALSDCDDARIGPVLQKALSLEEGGGIGTLAAAAQVSTPLLAEALARLATSRSPHIAFAAEIARVARGESEGQLLESIAPRIKESYRIDLCTQLVLPLVWTRRAFPGIAPALAVLRDTERHLGRWLLLAELGQRSGDLQPLTEARRNAGEGPGSARAAWSLVAWALQPDGPQPAVRPTLELVARLSDRPSADRDLTFLFRMASARLSTTKLMLESLIKSPVLSSEIATRAAGFLLRDHGRDDLERRLVDLTRSAKREPLRGLGLAVLRDARASALEGLALDLSRSRQVQNVAWSALVRLGGTDGALLADEPTFRRVQLGWPD